MSWELPAPVTGVEPVGVAAPAVEERTAPTEVPGVEPELAVGALGSLVVVVAEEVVGDAVVTAGAVRVPSAPEPVADDVSIVAVVTRGVLVVAADGVDTGTEAASTVVKVTEVVVVVVDGTELTVVDDASVVHESVVALTGAETVDSVDAADAVDADEIGADEVSAELMLEASAGVELDSLGVVLAVESADGVLDSVTVAGAVESAAAELVLAVVSAVAVSVAVVPATAAGVVPLVDPFVSLGP